MIRLLLAEDEASVRSGICLLLNSEADFDVIGQAENGRQAVELFSHLKPDVVIMDVQMPIMNGVKATKVIRQAYPDSKILIWTTFKEDKLVGEAIRSGALGYLLKNDPSDTLSASIRAVYRGCSTFSSGIINGDTTFVGTDSKLELTDLPNGFEELTQKEKDIFRNLGTGESYPEIAQKLYLTSGTVRNYVHKISNKLDIRGRTRLTLLANQLLESGLL